MDGPISTRLSVRYGTGHQQSTSGIVPGEAGNEDAVDHLVHGSDLFSSPGGGFGRHRLGVIAADP